ncbi:competence protein ComK [Oceanobacillus salinisoli]|uniref:competence protein ComK n=1 Tax=Oceanobacillus salinisoli TaxID=2678611 RepID=UPI0012E14620|nr:competence protein ComK [Oceanobacillus salinisoli]
MIEEFNTPIFEISPLTLAIIAEHNENDVIVTRIIEEDEEFLVDQTPQQVINFACKFFGSSLKGRQEGTRNICGFSSKIPISIDPSSGMYFFPTTSPKNSKCSWIAHSHIGKLSKMRNQKTKIIFKNGKTLTLDVSFRTMLNQLQRTAQFRFLLDKRLRFLQQQNPEMIAEPSPLDPE